MASQTLDDEKLKAITQRMVDVLNYGSLALMTSIGHQTGLFDTLAALPPATSEQVAEAAGLNERYVREWLGAMVVGRIVEYDPERRTYVLPPEHAAVLTRAAGPKNLATRTQGIALAALVEEQLIECFRRGGGVPYSAYPRFQAMMAQCSGQAQDALLLPSVLPLVAGLVERLEAGIDVADVGCGSGHAINLMAEAFPNSSFTGVDVAEDALARGRVEAERLGLTNVRFEVRDAAVLGYAEAFDLITAFDAIHDQAFPRRVLNGVAAALRPDGVFLMADVRASSNLEDNLTHPMGPYVYTISTTHCMTVSLAQGGEGLGTAWGEQTANRMLREAGFTHVETKKIPEDIFNVYYVARVG
jgi:SAM-dependent methyltransferase